MRWFWTALPGGKMLPSSAAKMAATTQLWLVSRLPGCQPPLVTVNSAANRVALPQHPDRPVPKPCDRTLPPEIHTR